ncbi:MAG TPA: nitroreductase/quinone reductase family protein, partial [Candidatus Limnocylindria bacterium]|nr:nitroreductase/quinone reductase family protein [Candidatus Limnocylindria bacterium]
MQALWHMHRLAYRVSGGRAAGDGTLAIHTVGRRSGEPRMTLLNYLDDGGRYVVVASNAGSQRHPAWWLNLQARSGAEVVVGGRRVPVRAHRANGVERERLWERILEWNPVYAAYAAETARSIPVVVLEPVSR